MSKLLTAQLTHQVKAEWLQSGNENTSFFNVSLARRRKANRLAIYAEIASVVTFVEGLPRQSITESVLLKSYLLVLKQVIGEHILKQHRFDSSHPYRPC